MYSSDIYVEKIVLSISSRKKDKCTAQCSCIMYRSAELRCPSFRDPLLSSLLISGSTSAQPLPLNVAEIKEEVVEVRCELVFDHDLTWQVCFKGKIDLLVDAGLLIIPLKFFYDK